MDKQIEMKTVLEKYLAGKASSEEQALLETWYLQYPLDGRTELPRLLADQDLAAVELVLRNLSAKTVKRKLWPRWAAAAAILLVIGTSLFYFNNVYRSNNSASYLNNATHITPGKNTATLTLANGKTINLSDAKTGVIINTANSAVAITYNDGTALLDRNDVERLTASTPRGGQYTITLPDGTKVWLNAESSIRFPSTFSGLSSRTVELFGEAYFEVAKVYKPSLRGKKQSSSERIPFFVKTHNQQVEVLGTHFNISSYTNEATKTTLLEGSVKVSSLRGGITLKPNQQSTLTNTGTLQVTQVDASSAIDWKNGLFVFENESLENIMKKIERWYDVQVVFEGKTSTEGFGGTISKYKNVDQVLNMLELTELVHFKIEGRKIIVMK